MTDSIPDPRAEALRRELQFDKTTVQLILEAVDASDEASGVRRVTAQELAAERRRVEVASIDLDELPSWDELAEATGATLVNHEVGCSGEYETVMHWPDGRVAHNRDRLAIISADAELDAAAIERAHRASEAQFQADQAVKRAAFSPSAADSPVGGVS